METVVHLSGGSIDANRYYTLAHPVRQTADDRTPEDIISNIKKKVNGG